MREELGPLGPQDLDLGVGVLELFLLDAELLVGDPELLGQLAELVQHSRTAVRPGSDHVLEPHASAVKIGQELAELTLWGRYGSPWWLTWGSGSLLVHPHHARNGDTDRRGCSTDTGV